MSVESFTRSAEGTNVKQSRGAIFSDCDCTLFDLKNGTGFFKDYFVFLIGLKNSGYDVVIHSASPDANLGRVGMYSGGIAGDREFFQVETEEEGLTIVAHKDHTAGWKGLAAFDDNHTSHTIDTNFRFDTNDDHVRDAIIRIANEYEASGRTAILTFNPLDFVAPAPAVVPNPNGFVA